MQVLSLEVPKPFLNILQLKSKPSFSTQFKYFFLHENVSKLAHTSARLQVSHPLSTSHYTILPFSQSTHHISLCVWWQLSISSPPFWTSGEDYIFPFTSFWLLSIESGMSEHLSNVCSLNQWKYGSMEGKGGRKERKKEVSLWFLSWITSCLCLLAMNYLPGPDRCWTQQYPFILNIQHPDHQLPLLLNLVD